MFIIRVEAPRIYIALEVTTVVCWYFFVLGKIE
jgi:hypothetical protein